MLVVLPAPLIQPCSSSLLSIITAFYHRGNEGRDWAEASSQMHKTHDAGGAPTTE